ncbi:alpha-amylase family glycosyl hydrolase [Streptomyces sp. WZ-12]|uniref:alpha-amylase family glycosyl hydrolase n=1 Tax=Streptomyces sp. WZ-12 TaxID=3030210 RepID=UPI0023814EC8|nr:alpha-amylase family glycosyl hydrolase [Streptomyces sp. WZ-12]
MTTHPQIPPQDTDGPGPWWREAVLYQIYPRSFADSNGDGIGDLRGIISRLDHLRDGTPSSLGVDALWLSPFYPSPQADFGYDISDYQDVDPVYGTLADFDELVVEAHRRGLRVVVDLVMNHTSTEHPWFTESRSSRANPKRNWYIWADPAPDGGPPNNWLSAFEKCGPAWTLDPATGQYYLHSFTPGQPDLNWREPAVREAMRKVWRFWLDRGVDGFRADVAHRLLKDERLRDNPPELAPARRHVSVPGMRQRQLDLPEVHDVLRELREVLDSYPGLDGSLAEGRFVLGEVPISDDSRLADYFGGEGMHTVFHIAFWEQPWEGAAFRRTVDGLLAAMRPGSWPTYALATHDISRTVSRFGGWGPARAAAVIMLTLPGTPCVYYGEEIGMADAPPPAGLERDVDGRDGQRTPMQWDASGKGFGTGTPWLAPGPDAGRANVEAQRDDSESMLGLYRRLIRYRGGSAALRRGGYRSLDSSGDSYVYLRQAAGELLLVAVNFRHVPAQVEITGVDLPAAGRIELSTHAGRAGATVPLGPLALGPLEAVVVRLADGVPTDPGATAAPSKGPAA